MENCLFVSGVIVIGVLIVFLIQQGEKFCAAFFQNYNVCGHLYNGTIKKGKQMLFEDVISEDAINALTPSQIAEIEAILEKAGY